MDKVEPKPSPQIRRTDLAVVDRVRHLAPTHTDLDIAQILNQEGFIPGLGRSFSRSKVEWIRYAYHVPTGCPESHAACPDDQRGDGRYSAHAAAELLNVTVYTIAEWCKSGRLDGIQTQPRAPWWVRLTPEIIAELRKPERRRWSHRSSE
jgi:hypothetical protein